ncbi:MAG: aldo/keto reductase [Planctomycetota bacterium]
MRYRTLGTTDVRVSEIGFGCWTMGGPNWSLQTGQPIGWGDVNHDDVLAGLRAGLDAGVNHFDNADIYGNGRAERLLRDCLRSLGVPRDELVIATKVGHAWGTAPHPYEPHHIRHQCEQSLRNLGLDHLDLYYFHHGSFADDNQPGNLHDAAGEMRRLVDEGKVRAVGQSAYSDGDFERAIPVVKPDVLQSWASMLQDNFIRPGARLQRLMDDHACTFVAFSPLGQGILLDKFDPENPPAFEEGDIRASRENFTQDRLRSLRPRLERLKERFGSGVEDLASAACRFVAAHPNVCSVIPGFRNERQARCNVRAGSDRPMTPKEVDFCREVFAGSSD